MRIFWPVTLLTSALALSACGGGGGGRDADDGGDGEPAPLSSKSDVLRELSIVVNAAQLFGYGDGLAEARASVAKRGGVAVGRWGKHSVRSQNLLKAATRHNCGSGSYTLEEGSGNETFGYFGGSSHLVNYEIYNYDDCYVDHGSSDAEDSDYDDGRVEYGQESMIGDPVHRYSLLGSGDTPHLYRNRYEPPSGGRAEITEFLTLGRLEFRTSASQEEQRSILSLRLTSEGADDYLLDLDLGNGSDGPFAILDDENNRTLSLSGPYRYHSTVCDWTYAEVSTPTPLAVTTDGFTAGRLRIESGRGLATITFSADGSARYETSGGNSGTLNAAEIGLAVSELAC